MSVFDVYRGACNTWECDQMGHMNVQHYLARLAHSWAHLRQAIGVTTETLRKHKLTLADIRDVVRYKRELHAGDPMHMTARVVEVGDKTVRFFCEMWKSETGELSASFDTTGLFIDLDRRKAVSLPADIRARAEALIGSNADIPAQPQTDQAFAALPDGALFETYRGSVNAWETDYLGHMNIQFYTDRYSHAAGQLFAMLELPRDRHVGSAAVQYDLRYLKELRVGDPISVKSVMLAVGGKTLRFGHRLVNLATGETAATADIVGVTFDLKARKAIPVPDVVRRSAEKLMARG